MDVNQTTEQKIYEGKKQYATLRTTLHMSVLHSRIPSEFFTFWFLEHRTKTTYHKGLNSIHVNMTKEKKSTATGVNSGYCGNNLALTQTAARQEESSIPRKLFTDKKELSLILEGIRPHILTRHSLFTS